MSQSDPHADTPLETVGGSLGDADAAVVMMHGRGATAFGMRQFADELAVEDVAFLAPQAANNTWYPHRFTAPLERNQPWLDSALAAVDAAVARAVDAVGHDHVVLLGFSQGACLASEYVARNARAYGGLVALSGGLIGPAGAPRDYDGSLDGTPVFLGCDADDPHIPRERVHETAAVLDRLGADVTEVIYDDLGHGVNREELEYAADIVQRAGR
jgi:predicted esterase